jgi:hypothetical protein
VSDASFWAKIGCFGGADASSLLVKVDLLRRTITPQKAIAEDLARKLHTSHRVTGESEGTIRGADEVG